jgi:hypothetical protein
MQVFKSLQQVRAALLPCDISSRRFFAVIQM